MPTLTLTITPATATPGDTVTARYAVADLPGPSPQTLAVTGQATINGQPATVTTTIEIPGAPHAIVYLAPVATGIEFTATDDPSVWTAVVP